jgi:hypothetical protein
MTINEVPSTILAQRRKADIKGQAAVNLDSHVL